MNQSSTALVARGAFFQPGVSNPVLDASSPQMVDALFATSMGSPTGAGTGLAISTASDNAALAAAAAGSAGQVASLVAPARYLLTDGESTYFRNLPLAQLEMNELSGLLDGRKSYKRRVFEEARALLEQHPDLADVPLCVDLKPAGEGKCLQIERPEGHGVVAALNKASSTTAPQAYIPSIRRKHALVIGLNQYHDKRIPQLFSAVPDAQAMRDTLAGQLGYEVTLLENPGKSELLAQLNRVSQDIGADDSLVVYFAGHGELIEKTGMGYWIPADASATDPRGWVSNADVSRWLAGVRSRQVVLISDSCYSGTFAKGLALDAPVKTNEALSETLLRKRTVTVMSSGSDEPVADTGNQGHSVFAWSLLEQLRQLDRWTVGQSVFAKVQVTVERELPQSPQYAASLEAGHELGGDFLFERRSKSGVKP
ncbi:MAG: caspase family protein [Curvibacter sp.]|nr:MAG: caspase family protein [Curvibacter sp.]